MLSEATIEELRVILREDYGYETDMRQATDIAYGLHDYFDTLAAINHQANDYDKGTKPN